MLKLLWIRQTFKNTVLLNSVHPTGSREIRRRHELCCPLLHRKGTSTGAECVTKTFWILSAVSAVSNAGEVYDRHCSRDGVPQRQELHPQRPRCSQLHVSTVGASTFHSRFLCECVVSSSLSVSTLRASVRSDFTKKQKLIKRLKDDHMLHVDIKNCKK